MKIKQKLFISTMGLSVIIILMFTLTLYVTGNQKDDGMVINLAGRQRMLNQMMMKEILYYAMTTKASGQKNTALADSLNHKKVIFDKALDALKDSGRIPLSLDPSNTDYRECPKAEEPAYSQLDKVKTLWKTFSSHIDAILGADSVSDAELEWIMQNNMPLLTELNTAVEMLQAQSEAKIHTLIAGQIFGVVLGLIFMGFSMLTVVTILTRLNLISRFADQLGEGDLTVSAGFASTDELGQIGSDLDTMIRKLKKMIEAINGDIEKLHSSSGVLSGVSRQMSKETKDVSLRSGSVAAAAEEMSSNMNSVAAATEEASTNISIVAASSEEMTKTINDISINTGKAQQMTKAAVKEAEDASAKVNELGVAAKEIGQVTETITEISEQTNLLALNATIEAARAGEAGKGFSVVANEIKELARQTSDATHEIKQKIERIQNSTRESVEKIQLISTVNNQVNDIVTAIAGKVEEQSITTREITGNVLQASQGTQEVTENTSQASLASADVAREIAEVNLAANTLFANSTQVSGNADELKSLAENLKKTVSRFKI